MIANNTDETATLKTLDDALAFMAQTLAIVERYRYGHDTAFSFKERDQMNALIALTKTTLHDMFYAAHHMQECRGPNSSGPRRPHN